MARTSSRSFGATADFSSGRFRVTHAEIAAELIIISRGTKENSDLIGVVVKVETVKHNARRLIGDQNQD
jgi:hypothetical protein